MAGTFTQVCDVHAFNGCLTLRSGQTGITAGEPVVARRAAALGAQTAPAGDADSRRGAVWMVLTLHVFNAI